MRHSTPLVTKMLTAYLPHKINTTLTTKIRFFDYEMTKLILPTTRKYNKKAPINTANPNTYIFRRITRELVLISSGLLPSTEE